MRLCTVLFAIVVGFVAAVQAEEPLVSGLKPGQRPGPYSSIVSTGAERGQSYCYICETEDRPAVVVFARGLSAPLGKLVSQLDKQVEKNKDAELRAWVTFLNEDQSRLDPRVVAWSKQHDIGHVPLGVFEDPLGPPTYRLNKNAEVTILLFVKQKVVSNFSFRPGELDDKQSAKVLQALAGILPEEKKPAAQAPAKQADWAAAEQKYLKNIKQLTSDFVRAGEGYFSPDMKKIIFQAEEKDTGNPFYQIFVMDLDSGKYRRVSPGIGKTTCSYFSPDGKKIIFASSHLDPDAKKKQKAEYAQRAEDKKKGIRRRYKWDFDEHMDIFEANPDGTGLKRLTDAKGYDAEGSFSADGKQIVFTSNRSGPENMELYIMDADGKNVRKLTDAPKCYNGGPFFSPDGKQVTFRSDRKKKDHLQLFTIGADGKNEKARTDDLNWVYWAPYWYKDGKHIIYTAADHSDPTKRPNYDLYWMNLDTGKTTRITQAPGADVLPVFSPDYKKVMWTSTRSGRQPAQLYIADFTPPQE